jgi:hypothetical protein
MLLVLAFGCRKAAEPAPTPPALPVAPDRLAPSEPLIGTAQVWGIRVPDGLRVSSEFARNVHLSGSRPLAAVTEALRQQLLTNEIEVTPTRTVIAQAYVKGASDRRLLRIEALSEGVLTRVNITDITPVPVPSGLSEAERWERAGRNPDGTVKDPSQVL